MINRRPKKPKNNQDKSDKRIDLIRNLVDDSLSSEIGKIVDQFKYEMINDHDDYAGNYKILSGITKINYLDDYSGNYINRYELFSDKKNVSKQLRTIDRRKTLDLSESTSLTHDIIVTNEPTEIYVEKINRKVVGKETVDWWEYVMLYGFYKALKIMLSLEKYKSMIGTSVLLENSINKGFGKFVIFFKAKSKGVFHNEVEVIDGEKVSIIKGIIYQNHEISINLPFKEVTITNEYIKDNLIFKDDITTFEIDNQLLVDEIHLIFDKFKIDESLRVIIAKEIYGRLRRI